MNDLVRLTARQAVNLLKKGQVSPMELIDAAAARIAECDPALNALPTLCLERARDRAARLQTESPSDPPPWYLHGLPIAVKDLEDVAGVRTTYGSPIFADHVPAVSNIAVQVLEKNGALVLAKSNTPEFGAGGNTFNEVFGATRNPWQTNLTCGGSSGGSATALASGQVWLATGSDLGGSLRIPASFCSVVGFRPSPGRVAFGPEPTPWQSLAVLGPMGRTVGDAALMLDAQAGQVAGDPRSLPRPARPFVEAVDQPARLGRVAFSPDLNLAPVQSEVKAICAKAAQDFSQFGAKVEEAALDLGDAEEIFQTLRAGFFLRLAPQLSANRDLLKPEVIWNIERGLELSCAQFIEAEQARAALYQRTVKFFETYDLLLCPTVVAPPFEVDIRYLTEVEGTAFDSYIGWLILTFALTLTACPAISIPCGFTKAGLPVGLQIVGPPRGEAQVLSAAALFEEAFGLTGLTPIDPRPVGD